jgi:membrane associated rhomboid family serine protease/antitoxin component YwqK of YwqJK toxin-antitoxin module
MTSTYPVTIILIVLNCVVFLGLAIHQQSFLMNSSADVLAILEAGANLNPYTVGGEYWRLFSCIFLHFGVLYLAVNMFALWALGRYLETGIGSIRFILLYLICGVAASLASLFFNIYVISAGASGAIFGLYGYQLGAQLIGNLHDKEVLKNVLVNFVIFAVINTLIASGFNVDVAGHIGGGLTGLVIAFIQMRFRFLRKKYEMALLLIALPFVVAAVPDVQLTYYRIFNEVVSIEDRTDHHLKAVKDNGILIDSLQNSSMRFDSLRRQLYTLTMVPQSLAQDTTVFSKYITLRQRELSYRMKVIDESYIYLDSLEILPVLFDSLPKLNHIPIFSQRSPAEPKPDQSNNTTNDRTEIIKVYYDKDWKETEQISEAKFFRLGSRDSLGRWQGNVRDYYMTGEIQMKGNYKNDLQDGVFLYYSDHMTYTSAGRYNNENPVGKWELFHPNGKIERELFYGNGLYVKTIWDSAGNEIISNGNGQYKRWYGNGALAEEGPYVNGQREGYWYGYHENGEPFYKELFKDNRLVSGASRSVEGKQFVYDNLSEYPFPVSGMGSFQKYLRDEIEHEKIYSGCGGSVKILFNVGPDGSLWDFVILQGRSHECNLRAIDLVKNGPKWRSALEHGFKPVVSQTFIEVKF